MKEFLEPLQHDALFTDAKDGESEDGEGSGSALLSFGSEALARAISEHGGFGIDHAHPAIFCLCHGKKDYIPTALAQLLRSMLLIFPDLLLSRRPMMT